MNGIEFDSVIKTSARNFYVTIPPDLKPNFKKGQKIHVSIKIKEEK